MQTDTQPIENDEFSEVQIVAPVGGWKPIPKPAEESQPATYAWEIGDPLDERVLYYLCVRAPRAVRVSIVLTPQRERRRSGNPVVYYIVTFQFFGANNEKAGMFKGRRFHAARLETAKAYAAACLSAALAAGANATLFVHSYNPAEPAPDSIEARARIVTDGAR